MPIRNYYNGWNCDADYLYDLKGSNNGTLAAQGTGSKPTAKNGYVIFVRVNATNGGYVLLARSSFEYTALSSFSWLGYHNCDNANANNIANISTGSSAGRIRMAATTANRFHAYTSGTTSGVRENFAYNSASDYSIMTFRVMASDSTDLRHYIDGSHKGTNTTEQSGDLYRSDSKMVIGGRWDSTGAYTNFFGGKLKTFVNFDHKLSAAEQKNWYIRLKGIM